MDDFIEYCIKRFFSNRKEIFGENSVFVRFKADKIFPSVGNNSRTIFGNIEYKIKGEICLSESFCLKVTPNVVNFDASTSYSFMNEMYFYSKILPFLASEHSGYDLFPKYIDGFLEMNVKEENAMLILNNLNSSGYTSDKQKLSLNFEHLSLMMRKLGEFHGLSYKMKNLNPDRFYSLAASCSPTIFSIIRDVQPLLLKGGNHFLQLLRRDPMYSKKLGNFEKVMENPQNVLIESIQKNLVSPIAVFTHFNYRKENALFRYENDIPVDIKILDMAYIGLGSPWSDIALLLYLHADQKMRDEHWEDLFDEYYKRLSETCPSQHLPTKELIKKEITDCGSWIGIFWSMLGLPRFLAREKGVSEESLKVNDIIDGAMNVIGTEEILDIFKDALNRGLL